MEEAGVRGSKICVVLRRTGKASCANTIYLVILAQLEFPYSVYFREQLAISNQSSYTFCIFPIWLNPFGNLFFKLIEILPISVGYPILDDVPVFFPLE